MRSVYWVVIIISQEQSFLLSWYKRNKRSSLKIESLKTSSKFYSVARAVRLQPADCCHFTSSLFFYAFYLRAGWGGFIRAFAVTDTAMCLEDYLFFCLDTKETKNHCLKIQNLKTISKLRSAARAVRPMGSTRGLLTFHFFVVFYAFYLRSVRRGIKETFVVTGTAWCHEDDLFFCLDAKETKDQAWIFLSQKHRTNFPIATPAARVSYSTRGLLPSAKA